MAEPADMIMPMLREMRAENSAAHERTQLLIAALHKRLAVIASEAKQPRGLRAGPWVASSATPPRNDVRQGGGT